jgi:DNA-directed RNA polymerase subunit RPC12/RpoP
MMKRHAAGVPAFLIGDDMIVGLDKSKILALTDHRVVSCPECGTKMRLPANKGQLKVTCSNCGNRFLAKPK